MPEVNGLKNRLQKISEVFDIEKILSLNPDKQYIQRYYQINQIPYTLFHTNTDLIYMGISRDGVYKADDLLEAARTVERDLPIKCQKSLGACYGKRSKLFLSGEKISRDRFQRY
ncbi:MAG: hypothetical protein HY396_00130 [Candidatus Doudnabacteria bacterium]|nr:hypothetical protein [Candidatus Doudnabacteria bacterium]